MNWSTSFSPESEAGRILSAVLDASDDAIIATDLNGTMLTWNRAAERIYGYSSGEMLGQSIAVLIPESRSGEFPQLLGRVNAGERVRNFETVRRTKDGRIVDVSLTVSPISDEAGGVLGACVTARDVTARNRTEATLQTSDARWRSVVESAVDGIVIIDAVGRIEAFNPAAERLFGYTEQEVLGRNVKMLMPAPYHDEHDGYLERYLTTGVHKIIGIGREVTGLRCDGTTFPLHLSVGEMVSGGERRFTGILHDLSGRIRMEERLREQAALARLGEMAAVIAHEVKNPLAGVRGAIRVIGGRLPPESKDAAIVKEIVARIDALNDLMKDLLLFARPPQLRPGLVDVGSLVTTTAELLSGNPAVRGVRVVVEGNAPPVLADPEMLKIVFVNLLVNGAHAMQGHGQIRVSLDAVGSDCRIAFADSGTGIPLDVREKIFTPFFTTKSRGTGLGLPTAKRLIEAHAGSIRVECPPEGGTTVIVQLPV